MEKEKIVKNLRNTYCRIKKSDVDGVGVFAIKDIPKDTDPFPGIPEDRWMKIEKEDVEKLDEEVKDMVRGFFGNEKDGGVWVPEFGLNGMNISFFMNHSEKPNVLPIDGGNSFRTMRKIKKGEELLISYSLIDR